MQTLKSIPIATKRVVLGPVPQQITTIADEENVDLIIMSPRRQRALRHWLSGGITDPRHPPESMPGTVRYRAAADKVMER